MTDPTPRRWRLGVIGLGVAGRGAVEAARALAPRVVPTRACDPGSTTTADVDLRIDADAETLCRAADVDVVYVASPSPLHAEHAELAARHGKHVLVEKPMAVTAGECTRIVEAAATYGVHVLAVHTPSFEPPLQTARAIVESGAVGRPLHLTQVKYVPWLLRPRLPEELDNDRGGGVLNRQGPHQVDTALYLLGAAPATVYATVGSHPRWPGTDGHYTAMVTFSGGAVATMVFNGYGHYATAAMSDDVGEDGFRQLPGAGQRLRRLAGAAKEDMRSGRIHEVEHGYAGAGPRFAPISGWSLLSCEDGDLLQSPTGIVVHRPDGVLEVPFQTSGGHLADAFDELDRALETGGTPLHDGRWGRRVVEVVEAIRTSAATGRTVVLEPGGS